MRIHYLQHVPFEKPGYIHSWIESTDHQFTGTALYKGEDLPSPDEIDALIVMGGPMGVYDEESYPWLAAEKEFISRCINQQKKVLGICLGAQLIADVLGVNVHSMPEKEIGWFPLNWTDEARNHPLLDFVPDRQPVLHWHGDMFELPAGALPLASSEGCTNQGFLVDDHILGLQFHLEMTPEGLDELILNAGVELSSTGAFVQEAEDMLHSHHFESNNRTMAELLNRFFI